MNTNETVGAWRSMWVVAAFALIGCAGSAGDLPADSELLTSVEDETAAISSELSSGVPIGSTLSATANLNLRTGAGMGYSVRLVIPSGAKVTTINRSTPSGGWYNIKYNGISGWSYGSYLKLVSTPTSGGSTTTTTTTTVGFNDRTPAGAVKRAQSGVGFSYHWGHGSWLQGGATSSNRGACYGSCPNCSHSGTHGADCSGYVAKLWQVPSSNDDVSVESHPYGTIHFVNDTSQWHTVARSNAKKADAFVYNSGGAGHIFLFESGDGWGSLMAYEAKGCSYGIKHNLRTASSAYHAIRRTGF
jgi:uncharacterized protein YraI